MNIGYLIAGRKHTLIIVRRTLTEPKTALAGVIVEISFARFKVWMATFNEERVPSRPFGFCELLAMTQSKRGCEKTMRGRGCEQGRKP